MNCRQAKRAIPDYLTLPDSYSEVEDHVRSCRDCGRELALEKLTDELIKSHSLELPDPSYWDEVRLVNRIKSRIREIGDRNAGSWENAIIAVRGWLVAFGVVAILLLVLSSQMAISENDNRQDSAQNARTESNLGEDIVSNNVASGWLAGEEPENGQ